MAGRTFALSFGTLLAIAGAAGFVPAMLSPPHPEHPMLILDVGYGQLVGWFPVNVVLDLLHALLGLWGLIASRTSRLARHYARSMAVAFSGLTIAGFVPGPHIMFGFAPLFGNDIWLHALLAALAAFFGWVHHDSADQAPYNDGVEITKI